MAEERWCDWSECVECPLALYRRRSVCARGGAKRRVMLVGEAPGENEENQGFAFVGASGKLLDHWLAVLDLTEKDVYITNVVKCRPPNNRDPTPFEIEACLPWLQEEIKALDPVLIVPLGRFAKDVCSGPLRMSGHVTDKNYGVALKHPAWYLRQGGMGTVPTAELKFLRRKLDGDMEEEEGWCEPSGTNTRTGGKGF